VLLKFQQKLDRGEPALDYTVVVDCILAPIYLRALTARGIDESDLDTFVERTLTTPTPHR
jgi:hypothetical protein